MSFLKQLIYGHFFENANADISLNEKVEFIDIGGPSMLRSGAKNFNSVTVITDVEDYAKVQQEIAETGDTTLETRKKLAGKVFNLTSAYDGAISKMLLDEEYPQYLNASYKKVSDLRYGENPHQQAALYIPAGPHGRGMAATPLGDQDVAVGQDQHLARNLEIGGQGGDGHVAPDRGQAGIDQIAATVGDTPGHRQQGGLRMRRIGVDQEVVFARRWARGGVGQGDSG